MLIILFCNYNYPQLQLHIAASAAALNTWLSLQHCKKLL